MNPEFACTYKPLVSIKLVLYYYLWDLCTGSISQSYQGVFLLAGRESVPTQEEQNEADMSLEAEKVVTDGNSNGKGGNA